MLDRPSGRGTSASSLSLPGRRLVAQHLRPISVSIALETTHCQPLIPVVASNLSRKELLVDTTGDGRLLCAYLRIDRNDVIAVVFDFVLPCRSSRNANSCPSLDDFGLLIVLPWMVAVRTTGLSRPSALNAKVPEASERCTGMNFPLPLYWT